MPSNGVIDFAHRARKGTDPMLLPIRFEDGTCRLQARYEIICFGIGGVRGVVVAKEFAQMRNDAFPIRKQRTKAWLEIRLFEEVKRRRRVSRFFPEYCKPGVVHEKNIPGVVEDERRVRKHREDQPLQRRRRILFEFSMLATREIMEVRPLRTVELQRRRDRIGGAPRNRHVTTLFEPSVESGADSGEFGDLFATKARRTAAAGSRQTQSFRRECRATATQEICQLAEARIETTFRSVQYVQKTTPA